MVIQPALELTLFGGVPRKQQVTAHGPEGEICGTCSHLDRQQPSRTVYFFCGPMWRDQWKLPAIIRGDSCARRRKSSKACSEWECLP